MENGRVFALGTTNKAKIEALVKALKRITNVEPTIIPVNVYEHYLQSKLARHN